MCEACQAVESGETCDGFETTIREIAREEAREVAREENETNDDLREENDDLREKVEELEDDLQSSRSARKTLFQKVHAMENGDGSSGDGSSGIGTTTDDASSLPIEQLSGLSDDDRFTSLNPAEERAITLWENLPDWGKYNSSADRLTIKNDRHLHEKLNEAREDDRIAEWNQRDRMLRAAERLSKGTAEHRETNRHGWVLVVEQPGTVWPSQFPTPDRQSSSAEAR